MAVGGKTADAISEHIGRLLMAASKLEWHSGLFGPMGDYSHKTTMKERLQRLAKADKIPQEIAGQLFACDGVRASHWELRNLAGHGTWCVLVPDGTPFFDTEASGSNRVIDPVISYNPDPRGNDPRYWFVVHLSDFAEAIEAFRTVGTALGEIADELALPVPDADQQGMTAL
ncbi:MAG: hypothetical protein AAF543_08510 [Pseudomonadota bacterium]